MYSIAVARNDALYRTNITLGSYADMTNYTTSNWLTLLTDATAQYGIDAIGFGTVYNTNGVPSSQYYSNFTDTGALVTFNTNFRGLGLPATQFSEFSTLLMNITGQQAACNASIGGTCQMPGTCESWSNLTDFSFQILFSSNTTDYIQVPLSDFAMTDGSNCVIEV